MTPEIMVKQMRIQSDDAITKAFKSTIEDAVYYDQLLQAVALQMADKGILIALHQSTPKNLCAVMLKDSKEVHKFYSINEAITFAFELYSQAVRDDSISSL